MDISRYDFSSLPEYLSAIKRVATDWNDPQARIWYRGVDDVRFGLVPRTAWRGISLNEEETMMGEFLVYYRSYYGRTIEDGLELYTLMQHYGLPTRLLDWSMSPLVALYFALEMEDNGGAERAVWAMDCSTLNSIVLDIPQPIVPRLGSDNVARQWLPKMLRQGGDAEIPDEVFGFEHPMSNQRIQGQKGCFTFHGRSNRSIDQVFREADSNRIVHLRLAEPGARDEILNDLYALGYKEDDIYRDLNALSRRIIREHGIRS